MSIKIEPFKRLEFYHFNCKPNIEQYDKIMSWLRNEGIAITDDDGIETDFHFQDDADLSDPLNKALSEQRHKLWSNYIDICCGDKIQEMLKDAGYTDCIMHAIWTQISTSKTWHPPHTHGESNDGRNWSFVYYIDVDKDSGHQGTMFWNPAEFENTFHADCVTGNMYLWPSSTLHCQPPSFSEKERIILSGNLELC